MMNFPTNGDRNEMKVDEKGVKEIDLYNKNKLAKNTLCPCSYVSDSIFPSLY